jgi:hypothetical protein
MTDEKTRVLLLRFYPDRDPDLIRWLDSLPDTHGVKTDKAKELLRAGLASPEGSPNGKVPAQVDLDAEILQGIKNIVETLPDELLPPIRKIVQNVIRRELATVSLPDQEEQEVEKIPSIEEALDAMESELVDTSINPRRPS